MTVLVFASIADTVHRYLLKTYAREPLRATFGPELGSGICVWLDGNSGARTGTVTVNVEGLL
jgi:hypothetical protein